MLKEKIMKKVNDFSLVRLLKSKAIIKELNNKIGELAKEKQQLIDRNRILAGNNTRLSKQVDKVVDLELKIQKIEKKVKEKTLENKELIKKNIELNSELFEMKQEMLSYKIQCEEYEKQIEDYKTEGRYLVKKLKPGRTPNTIKTRTTKPMSASVTRYMRNEHE